jgi:glutamyl-tRNA synthetase/nondiscriminating glutamyl-tRNA synthetase
MPDNKVVTRFAPSPTGFLHLGNYRTAIFAYLYAKKHKGDFVLRIEDTDRERSKKEYEENIIESLKWLGLDYDKFYRQSEHVDKHKFYLEKMIKEGNAYISKEEAKDGSGVIKELVRFKNPNIDVTFKDEIKGEVTMNTKDLGDFIIAKNISEPLFHLAVVVDDFEAGITHVIRGEDHVSNTPRQVLIQRAIGAPTPIYAHMPLVLGSDKLKLSKRRGALPLTEYKKQGFLPEAILNGVAFVGWNPGTEKEIFTRDELIEAFDFSRVQKSPAIFNEKKLRWFNKEHIKNLKDSEFLEIAKLFIDSKIKKLKNLSDSSEDELKFNNFNLYFRDRIEIFSELSRLMLDDITGVTSDKNSLLKGSSSEEGRSSSENIGKETISISGPHDYLLKDPVVADVIKLLDVIGNDEKNNNVKEYLLEIIQKFDQETWEEAIEEYAKQKGRGKVLGVLRLVLSGKKDSNNQFEIIKKIGIDSSLRRIKQVLDVLKVSSISIKESYPYTKTETRAYSNGKIQTFTSSK